ncbi:hypothetical protein KO507_19050 [Gilvimarinus agarilyticus]|nr:hypothetical protein [Gilvimarinus agarilyticus]MDO6572508.1 hypothetical protein [Gilvimarinus sp. 2_MG-2023]
MRQVKKSKKSQAKIQEIKKDLGLQMREAGIKIGPRRLLICLMVAGFSSGVLFARVKTKGIYRKGLIPLIRKIPLAL